MVQQIAPRALSQRLADGQNFCLIDLRQRWENELACLPGSVHIPLSELPQRLAEVPLSPEIPVVVYCHHGVRSLSGAAFLERLGYTNVLALTGGIDAWSCEVDTAVPRY